MADHLIGQYYDSRASITEPVQFAIGLAITIDTNLIDWARSIPSESFREVVISYNGREVEMTLEDFLKRVGLGGDSGGTR